MNTLKLGNDFSDNGEQNSKDIEESDEKTLDEESEDENENSGDPDNTKNEEDKSDDSSSEKEDNTDDDSDGKSKSDKQTDEDKLKILQGLKKTEEDLDHDVSEIDIQIAEAKKRISQKRQERRDKKGIVEIADEKFPDTEEETDDLSDIDPDTIKLLERFTKAKGLVPKSELIKTSFQEKHKQAESSFYETHKEYLPENDPDDFLYKELKKELSFFSAPKDPSLIPALFERAHKLVMQNYPDKFKSSKEVKSTDKKVDKDDQINKSVRLKNASLGGGSSGGSGSGDSDKGSSKKSLDTAQIRALQDGGWSDEEIKNLSN
jgi:hypothetical protein